MSAFSKGYMPQAQIDVFAWDNYIRARKDSKSWQRVKRDALMPTIMTAARPWDGVTGNCLHWDDHRLLTIMEVRRGQGYPDNEVIVGLPSEQWKIIGNSVARPVALALGLSIRTAWLANHAKSQTGADAVKTAHLRVVNERL
jgi:DNA (cytosine-5)-methyltransferase 1